MEQFLTEEEQKSNAFNEMLWHYGGCASNPNLKMMFVEEDPNMQRKIANTMQKLYPDDNITIMDCSKKAENPLWMGITSVKRKGNGPIFLINFQEMFLADYNTIDNTVRDFRKEDLISQYFKMMPQKGVWFYEFFRHERQILGWFNMSRDAFQNPVIMGMTPRLYDKINTNEYFEWFDDYYSHFMGKIHFDDNWMEKVENTMADGYVTYIDKNRQIAKMNYKEFNQLNKRLTKEDIIKSGDIR